MLSVETEYVWSTTAGSDGVPGVDGMEDDNEGARVRARLLQRPTVVGVCRRVGVLKRPERACMGLMRRGVAGLLFSVNIPHLTSFQSLGGMSRRAGKDPKHIKCRSG